MAVSIANQLKISGRKMAVQNLENGTQIAAKNAPIYDSGAFLRILSVSSNLSVSTLQTPDNQWLSGVFLFLMPGMAVRWQFNSSKSMTKKGGIPISPNVLSI